MKPSWAVTKLTLAPGVAGVGLVQVGTAGEPGRELAEGGGLVPPEVAHGVAVAPVPLRPQRGEVADLVPALPDVPRLGDELDLRDDGILLDQVEERGQPVDLVELAGQARGQVEAEPVHVHLGHPVPQRVHDELERARVTHVQAVPGAGGVVVEPRVVRHEPVVGGVVDALERQHGPEVVALGGVVVDDVEDDLDAGLVQRADHRLELRDLLAALPGGGVVVVRGEEADRVVAPVVPQSPLDQVSVVDELVHGQQLHRGHAELDQVVDRGRMGQPGVRAALGLRDVRVAGGEALDVDLVDDRLVELDVRRPVVAPVEVRVVHDRPGHERGAVVVVARVLVAERVGKAGRVPVDLSLDGLGVGVDEQLGRVAALAVLGRPRPVDPVAVTLPGRDRRQVGVPAERVHLFEAEPFLAALVVEQAQVDGLGHLGEQREVGPGAVVGGSEWIRAPRPVFDGLTHMRAGSFRRPRGKVRGPRYLSLTAWWSYSGLRRCPAAGPGPCPSVRLEDRRRRAGPPAALPGRSRCPCPD